MLPPSAVRRTQPPPLLLTKHQQRLPVVGDDLESGLSPVFARLPPTLFQRPWTRPGHHLSGGAVGSDETTRWGAELATGTHDHGATPGIAEVHRRRLAPHPRRGRGRESTRPRGDTGRRGLPHPIAGHRQPFVTLDRITPTAPYQLPYGIGAEKTHYTGHSAPGPVVAMGFASPPPTLATAFAVHFHHHQSQQHHGAGMPPLQLPPEAIHHGGGA